MGWSRFDDLYDDHPKVMAATHTCPLAATLHAQAITASSRRESDGLVDPFWLLARAPDKRKRNEALDVLVALRLYDLLPEGHTFELFDAAGFSVTVGPFGEDRHIVHDYLDYNPSSAQLTERRRTEAERKARGRRAESADCPPGHPPDTTRTPDGPRGGAGADPQPIPTPSQSPSVEKSVGSAGERSGLSATVSEVETLLSQGPRLHVDRVGVENAIASWPDRDPVRAARTVVTWATDPAFVSTNGAKLLGLALSKQTSGEATVTNFRPRGAQQPTAEDFMRIARGEA